MRHNNNNYTYLTPEEANFLANAFIVYGNKGRDIFTLVSKEHYYTVTHVDSVFKILYDINFSAVNAALKQYQCADTNASYVPLKEFEKITTPTEVLQACFYFEYQMRSFVSYSRSWAFLIIQKIKQGALGRLPGYQSSKWKVDM